MFSLLNEYYFVLRKSVHNSVEWKDTEQTEKVKSKFGTGRLYW